MSTVWEVKTHQSIMRSHDSLVDLQICRAAAESLHIDAPFVRLQVECLEGASLAGEFDGIDVLVATVVSGSRITFGVFVGHGGAESIVDSAGGDVLRGNQKNRFSLSLNLFFLVAKSIRHFVR